MKILLIVKSKHNDNTLKIAEAMTEVAPATLCTFENAANYNVGEYDIVGLGSGIYYGKHDAELMDFAEKLSDDVKYVFVFSTSGSKSYEKNNRALVKLLESKNKVVLGDFGCQGYDNYFIFKLFGGKNKNHPDLDDFDKAQQFICEIMKKYEQTKTV